MLPNSNSDERMSTGGNRYRESGEVETDTGEAWKMVREFFGRGAGPKAETAAAVIPYEPSARNEAAFKQRSRVVPRTTFVPSQGWRFILFFANL
jgi:hypothetical protein